MQIKVSQNGEDWIEGFAGTVQLVDITLSSIEPSVVSLKGDAEFAIKGSGFVDHDDIMLMFHPKVCSMHPVPPSSFT